MQKTYIISCCAECPAYSLRKERIPHCGKCNRAINADSENSVNLALIAFPEWCPLESAPTSKEDASDYKKEVKHIVRIMEDDTLLDPLQEASYYMNSVVKNAKKKTETN